MAKYTDKEMDRIISAGKKSYASMSNKGQPGGIASIPSSGKKDAFVQLQRQKFFDNRPDVSEDRILRRTRQEGILNQFKDALIRNDRVLKGTRFDDNTYTVMNPNTGEPVYLTDVPGGRSVGDVAQDLAFRFGPTPKELMSDVSYAFGNIAKGLAEKGTPLMQLGKAGIEGLQKFFAPKPKATYGGTSSITTTTETTPSFDLEAKMSAYEDPIKFYASSSKQKYPGYSDQQSQYYYGDKPKESPTGDKYLYADAGDAVQNYMNLLKNVQNLGSTSYGTFGIEDPLNLMKGKAPTFTYEKEIGPGVLSGKIGDNKASLGYSMIFNKGGRVRGTGIMGALR